MSGFAWTVPGRVVRVIDGDTIVVTLDQGWRVSRVEEHVRILGLFAAELGTDAGKAAKAYAEQLLPVGSAVLVRSQAKPSFERSVGSIELADGRDFATVMRAAGYDGAGTGTPA